jgi:broad specificity phosphatase PhoE
MRLYFIRHGQTTGDVEDRYGGAYDDDLSPLGQQQVQELASELADAPIEQIFASTLIRAQQTGRGIAKGRNIPIISLPDLQERDSNGPMSGLTKAEAKARHPEYVELVKDRLKTVPGAESYDAASSRMQRGFKHVVAHTKKCSAVVWHGGGMRTLFRDITKMGELGDIGDCAWVMMERLNDYEPFQIKDYKRLTFKFDIT